MIHQAPELHGVLRTRWCLSDLRSVPSLPWLAHYTIPGICLALKRLRVKRKQGRFSLYSPDAAYQSKIERVRRACRLARRYPGRVRVVYQDEFNLYRQPTRVTRYAAVRHEPTTHLSLGQNRRERLAGALDTYSGQLTWAKGAKMGVEGLRSLLEQLRKGYPNKILFLVWDNWPVHYHPRVLGRAAELGIHILWLPTYAPWTNPIEKLWRWLKQDVVHCHRLADRWPELLARVKQFLDRFAYGGSLHCTRLLRYVGLLPD